MLKQTEFIRKLIYICAVLTLTGYMFFLYFETEYETIHIALVSSFSGQDGFVGKSMLNAVQLCLKKHSQKYHNKIILDVYDDYNMPSQAQTIAKKIVQTEAVGVIGHHLSRCSLAASNIYLEHKIPAVTPLSTHTDVTSKNPFFFRTIFNDYAQSAYLAQYIKLIYKSDQAVLLHDQTEYGKDVAQYFEESFQFHGGNLIVQNEIQTGMTMNQKTQLINQIMSLNTRIPIIVSSQLDTGLEIIELFRKNNSTHPFFLPDIFYAKHFMNTLAKIEKIDQSFDTENIFVISPLFFQTANKAAHDFYHAYYKEYQIQPDWVAAYAYDTALALFETIDRLNLKKQSYNNVQWVRQSIKDGLTSMNHPGKGILGVTGWIYFDEKGDTTRQITIGKYYQSTIIPAMRQPMPSQWTAEPYQKKSHTDEKSKIVFNGTEMIVANMIYTNVTINKIRNINIEQSVATINFELSFRYMDENCNPEQLIFLNATQPKLSLVQLNKKKIGNEIWVTYEGHGDFYIDCFPGIYLFDKHQIGIQFQHNSLPSSHLIYIHDNFQAQQNNGLNLQQIIDPLSGWKATKIQVFQDIEIKTTLGNPEYIYSFGGKMGFSRFNYGVLFQRSQFSFRGLFTGLTAWKLFWFSAIILAVSAYVSRWPKFSWGIMTVSAFSVMNLGESLLMYTMAQYLTEYQLQWFKIVFDILWWILPAFFFNLFIRRFIFMSMKQNDRLHVANVVPRFLGFLIYLFAGLGIIAFVFDQEISKLLATGGVFAMMVGLAVKMNVADIISGIAINIESPFRLGDWIKIDSFEGVVTDITWRSTRVKTGENAIVCVPNSKATESSIQNFNTPGEMNWIKIRVPVSHLAAPEFVDNILMAAILATKNIVTQPTPKIFYKGTTELNAWFEVFFCIKDYANRKIRIDSVWTSIWKHFRYAEIQLSIMGQTLTFPQLKLFDILDSLSILDGVSREDKLELIPHFRQRSFIADEIIVDPQKISSNDFYIIQKGAVRVYLPGDEGEMIEVDRMGAGDYFGETGLLGEEYAMRIKAITTVLIHSISGDIIFACVDDREPFLDQLRHLRLNRMINREKQKNQYEDEQAEKDKKQYSLFSALFRWIKPTINSKHQRVSI